jgi:biotin carboxyl carrier protein
VFTKPPSRAGWWLLAALVVSLLVAIVSLAVLPDKWREALAEATPATGARTVEASVGTVKRVLRLEGLVVREPDQNIRAPIAGTITSIAVQPGDTVTAGTTLASLTQTLPPIVSSPSPSPILSPTPTGSPTTSPSPSPSPSFSPPPVAVVQAVSAPVDGQVMLVQVVTSQIVRAGKVMFVIEPSRFDVIAPVAPLLLYQFFNPPSEIRATIPRGPSPFDCAFVSMGDNLAGLDAQSLLHQDSDLRCSVPVSTTVVPGTRAGLSVTTGEADNVVVLPRRVISDVHDGEGIVWVVEKGHAPVKRTVGVGITDGHVMEITSGLQAGERVLDTAASPPPGS